MPQVVSDYDHIITSDLLCSVNVLKLHSPVLQISSTASANPLDVEDYLDCFEEMSSTLLEYVVNMTDVSVSM
jgi:hypothetical protein